MSTAPFPLGPHFCKNKLKKIKKTFREDFKNLRSKIFKKKSVILTGIKMLIKKSSTNFKKICRELRKMFLRMKGKSRIGNKGSREPKPM
jgi:hypothetical protein